MSMHLTREHWLFAVQFIFILLSYMTPPAKGTLHGISHEELANLFTEYEIVEPVVTDSQGNFISHDIKFGHKRRRRDLSKQNIHEQIIDIGTGAAEIFGRMPDAIDLNNDVYLEKNSYFDDSIDSPINSSLPVKTKLIRNFTKPLSNRNISGNNRHIYDNSHVYYNVSAFGTHYHLKLLPKKRLVAPGAKVVWFGYEEEEENLDVDCVYSGLIRHHHNSSVAITSCDGLSGMIKTAEDEFFIEPIDVVSQDKESKQRHVIYRRSAVLTSLVGKELGGHHGRERRGAGDTPDYNQRPRNALHGDTLAAAVTAHSSGQDTVFDYSRWRRHAKPHQYNMEVLLTADSSVIEFHGRDHVKFYLVTLMNIVDEIYHDESLGSHVNIVLVKLCLLDKTQSNSLIVVNDPPESLQNVCDWANNLATENPSPTGKRHDHAIFLTRTKFGPAGYAHVAGMCHPLRSCTLNLEDGFSSAFVVAHETGHSLGMEHDGERNKCGDETSMGSIMAPLVQAAFHRYHWSRCSQQEFNVHIGKFSCLLDDAERQEQFGTRPLYPGIPYTVDDQCRFDFGEGYKLCTAFPTTEVCRILWCSHEDNPLFCKTRNGGPVDGTKCGENRICFQNHCVWNDQSNWGPWSTTTECSRSCGVGATLRTRICNNPGSKGNDTSGCDGSPKEYVLCNKDPCPISNDFRAEQCTKQNRIVRYRTRKHNWLPYHNDELPCELYCESKQTHDVLSLMRNVEDGTPCSYNDPHGICLGGKCQQIGCDKVIGSGLQEDDCGICGGDGRNCKRFTGTYKQPTKRGNNAYKYMFVLPHGARKIKIQEDAYPYNRHLIAMKKKRKGSYILNTRGEIMEGDVHLHFIDANTRWEYSSRNSTETIEASGPTNVDISVLLVSRGKNVKTSIRYSYVIHPMYIRDNVYRYEIKKKGTCSTSCGEGTRPIKYKCRNKIDNRWVRNKHCSGKPPAQKREPCVIECRSPAKWQVGEWSDCTYTSCGVPGTQQRAVACRAPNGNGVVRNVSPDRCSGDKRPPPKRACSTQACACQWRTGAWSTCSQTCGTGFQRRRVLCRCGRTSSDSSRCGHSSPEDVKTCDNPACAEEECIKDKSLFCKLDEIAHYCSLPGFRKLCCKSCEDFSRSHPGSIPTRSSSEQAALGTIPRYANLSSLPDVDDPKFSSEFALAVKNGQPLNLSPFARGLDSNSTDATLVIPDLTEAEMAEGETDVHNSGSAVQPPVRSLAPARNRKPRRQKRSVTKNQGPNIYIKMTRRIIRHTSNIKT